MGYQQNKLLLLVCASAFAAQLICASAACYGMNGGCMGQQQSYSPPLHINAEGAPFSYSLNMEDGAQLVGRGASFVSNGVTYSTEDGSLQLSGKVQYDKGVDTLGSFEHTIWSFVPSSGPEGPTFEASIKVYEGKPFAVFEQRFPDGIDDASTGDENGVSSSFPNFVLDVHSAHEADDNHDQIGLLTCSGNMSVCRVSRWENDETTVNAFPAGLQGGSPLALFRQHGNNGLNVLISPFSNFMVASQVLSTDGDTSTPVIRCGIEGKVKQFPSAFRHSTLVVWDKNDVDKGVTSLFHLWGDTIRAPYDKSEQPRSDLSVNYLGYYTDNGAYYYYNSDDYQQTMKSVSDASEQLDIPYRYYQLDSWWYFKGENDGVTEWVAREDVFPHGLDFELVDLQSRPFVLHNRYWASDTVYSKQNGGQYDFITEPPTAIPTSIDFWRDLFKNTTKSGLRVYEQDWLHNEFERLNATLESATLGRSWLKDMGNAAAEYDVSIQYCMSYPRHLFQALEIDAVTHARVSDDYHPDNDQWVIGTTSLFAESLGIVPFKDTFWTTSKQPGDPYHGAVESAPELELTVALLSTGPVGPGDAVDKMDVELIRRTCRSDGLLLKPDRPSTAIEAQYQAEAFGEPLGQVWTTHTTIGPFTWHYVIAANLSRNYELTQSDLLGPRPENAVIAFSNRHGDDWSETFIKFGRYTLRKGVKSDFQLVVVAPSLHEEHEVVMLGETNKVAPVSRGRFVSVSSSSRQITVHVQGTANEEFEVAFVVNGLYKTVGCSLAEAGSGRISVVGFDRDDVELTCDA